MRQPCAACGQRDRAKNLTRCMECWLRKQPIARRQAQSEKRALGLPLAFHMARVPAAAWPPGRRWCAGCQSFILLEDCAASRCKTCAAVATHSARVKAIYGLEPGQYDQLLRAQDGRCAICRSKPRAKRLAVDHDHQTGVVRGLLCGSCNHDLLGAAHDSVDLLKCAIEYLEHPPATLVLN